MLRWVSRRVLYYNWFWAYPFPPSREAAFEDVWMTASDGVRLHARWYPCPETFDTPFGVPRLTVLFLHGNAGDVRRWIHIGSRWQDSLGANVLVLDYRGYGRSEGHSNEAGLQLDSRAAYNWLTSERQIDPSRIILCGQSLGGAVAVELATSGVAHAALVLESTFTNVRDVANRLFLQLPVGRWIEDEYPSLRRLKGYAKPLFISHGDRDLLIPLEHARQLIAVAEGPKELLVLPGMNHHDKRPASYGLAVRVFLNQHLSGA